MLEGTQQEAEDGTLQDIEDDHYLYDLLYRQPPTESILGTLRGGATFKSFLHQTESKWKSSRLSSEDITSMLYPDVVDWYDYQMTLIYSISECRATSKKNSIERSHDHIDAVETASKVLMDAYPPHIASSSDKHVKNQWRSMIGTFASEYMQIFDRDLLRGVGDLPTRIRSILSHQWEPDDKVHENTMYYVAGAVVRIIVSWGDRSKEQFAAVMKDIKSNAVTTKENAKDESLPCAKVEQKEAHQLFYPNQVFYKIVNKIESVFNTLLSEGEMAFYGTTIINDITNALYKEELGFTELLREHHAEDDILEAVRRIILSYGRLRGKDFVRKCNARMGARHHETTRSTLGTASAIASKNAKNGNAGTKGDSSTDDNDKEEESNPRWKYLMKQCKPDLVNMCKNRTIPYSGTKKVLTRRIIEHEVKLAAAATEQQQTQQSTAAVGNVATTAVSQEGDDHFQQIIEDVEAEEQELIDFFYNSN